jgi:Zn-dependent protease
MIEKIELGRIRGIRLVVDGTFIVLVVLWGMPWLTRGGSISEILFGIWMIAALAGSIVLHELGHAWAGKYYGISTSHIELNGLGGLCHYDSPMPVEPFPRIVMLLAGPAANLFLWALCSGASTALYGWDAPDWLPLSGFDRLAYFLQLVAHYNWWLLCFNLLPAYPLDGGRTLEALLRYRLDVDRARHIVGWLGLGVMALCLTSLPSIGICTLMIVFCLYENNGFVLASSGRPPWTRWN